MPPSPDESEGLIPRDEPRDSAESSTAQEDPDRVLRVRIVFAAATLLFGLFPVLFSLSILGFVLSGRPHPAFSAAALLLSLSVFALLARPPLRALSAARPDNNELRSAAGLLSLACGGLLLLAQALFIAFTFSALVTLGGAVALYIVPLLALAFLTLRFFREATDDFLKRVRLRREFTLFLTTIACFALTLLVFLLLVAASTLPPVISLTSPPDGSVIRPGTDIELAVSDTDLTSVLAASPSGNISLPSPYRIPTSNWSDGPRSITITARDASGNTATATFSFTVDSVPPTLSALSPTNNSIVPAGTPLRFSISDSHSFTATWTNGSGLNALPSPFEISTAGWNPGSYVVAIAATDVVGNGSALSLAIRLS